MKNRNVHIESRQYYGLQGEFHADFHFTSQLDGLGMNKFSAASCGSIRLSISKYNRSHQRLEEELIQGLLQSSISPSS